MKLYDAICDYWKYIEHELGVTKGTQETYKSWLRHFHRWLESNGSPDPGLDAFNLPTLRRFLYELSGRGYRPRTIRSIFHPLRGLGEFLITNGVITVNPAKQLTMPKLDAAERKTITEAEIAALLDACERQRTPRQIALSRVMLSVYIYGGLRRTEACDLRIDDVNLQEGSILIRQGKGQKSRKVFICQEGVHALREWLTVREKDCQCDYLFMFDRKRRIHENGLRTLLQTLKANAGLRDHDNILIHGLRHAAATRLLRNGANLKDISTFLGHSSLQVTSVYLHSNEEQAKQIAELTALRPQTPPQTKDDKIIHLRPKRDDQQERTRRRIAR
jgi:integrase/recombinase XerD